MLLSICLFFTLIFSLLSRFAVINVPVAPGVSGLYIAVAVMIPITLWYGGWGVIATYLGCIIGAGLLADMPLQTNLLWSVADVWQVMIPLAAFRIFNANVRLMDKRDLSIFLIFGVILNNLAGALWGSGILALHGLIPADSLFVVFEGWMTGNVIATLILSPLLLYYITPYLMQTDTYIRNYWN